MTGTLTTLVSFGGNHSLEPEGLIADANGDLFGVTTDGGANGLGTVFELVKTAGGYAATPTTLVSFDDGTNGEFPEASLRADSDGDLFGTTELGAGDGDGTVFEIVKTAVGYASTPTTLVSFNGTDGAVLLGGLIADSNGDLFGTTELGGAGGTVVGASGTVFEIAKTAGGYASTPTTLVSFNSEDGSPNGTLTADYNGDLFGTTSGDAGADGTVFEIVKTAAGYASAPTTLASFNIDDGAPSGSLIADANGDLIGMTLTGGGGSNGTMFENGAGTVFEIAKTSAGYASTPTTLVGFNGTNGAGPSGSLIADSNGDLFGTTGGGGASLNGTVFEIAKTGGGYASTSTTVVSFNGTNGAGPAGGLIADGKGDLFGTTTEAGASGDGTVFEIASGDDLLWQNANGQASIWDMSGNTLTGGEPVSPNPGPSWKAIGTGDFFGAGSSGLLFQNTNSSQISIWEMNGNSLIGGGPMTRDPGPNWRAVGIDDFNGDGTSDILLQNTSSGQVSIWELGQIVAEPDVRVIGGGPVTNPGPGVPEVIDGGAVASPGPSWRVVGTGDFNGDGTPDILLQNTSGQVSIWEMNGNEVVGGGPVSPSPGPSWKAIGTADLNGDGLSDILFQNTSSGQVSIWEMNGNKIVGGGPVSPNPGPSWHAIGTDGGSDILFQNTSGQTSIWEMSGNTLVGGGPVSPNPGSSWHAIGLT